MGKTQTNRLNNMVLKKKNGSKRKSENSLRQMKLKHNFPKSMGCSKSSSKKEVYNNSISPQETRKISNKPFNLTPKGTGERRNKPQS